MAPALFILGAAGFTLYPVAMAWACEKVEHHQLVSMNQALLLSYTIGSLVGPTLTAMLMQNYSDNLLFIMIAGVSFVYLMMLLRKAGHHPTRWPTPDFRRVIGLITRLSTIGTILNSRRAIVVRRFRRAYNLLTSTLLTLLNVRNVGVLHCYVILFCLVLA